MARAAALRLAAQGLCASRLQLAEAVTASSSALAHAAGGSAARHGAAGSAGCRTVITAAAAALRDAAACSTSGRGWGDSCFATRQQQQLGAPNPALAASAASGLSPAVQGRGFSSSAARPSQCDCPTLGGPTPDQVVVEYDEEEVDRFIALADAIEEAFPHIVVEGNPAGPGRPGAFEVTGTDGALLFSRLSSGDWPQAPALVGAIGAAADAAAAAAAEAVAACALPQQQAAAAAGGGGAA